LPPIQILGLATLVVWNPQSPGCQATSPNREIPDMLLRPCVQNFPGKIGEVSPSDFSIHYTHGKAAQRPSKDQLTWLHLRPSWVAEPFTKWGGTSAR